MKRSPIKPKRSNPRRNDGRIQHERITPKASAPPTTEERRHFADVIRLGCVVCGNAATIHHVTSDRFKRITRSHKRVVPLCPRHHQIQHGPHESVEALGHAGFFDRYGIDLLQWADDAWTNRAGA